MSDWGFTILESLIYICSRPKFLEKHLISLKDVTTNLYTAKCLTFGFSSFLSFLSWPALVGVLFFPDFALPDLVGVCATGGSPSSTG